MGMTRKIEIDGKEILFKASAAILRIYKSGFGRSILKGIKCEKSLSLPWCKLGDFY